MKDINTLIAMSMFPAKLR